MIDRILRFARQPASRQRQRIAFAWTSFVTRWFYGPRLRSLGRGVIIGKPLFWTPECIEIGNDVLIWPGCRFEGISQSQRIEGSFPRIVLGDGVSFQQYCHLTAGCHVEIGARTSVLFGVMITDIDHRYDLVNTAPAVQPLDINPTVIGEDCFIGARASIQAGTHLGRHCIVGTNAVVRGKYPDYCVIAGAPAKIIKRYDFERGMWRRTDASGSFLTDSD